MFAIYAATYAVSGACLLGLKLDTAPASTGEPFLAELVAGWQAFRARTWLWSVIAIFGLYGCFVVGTSLPIGTELVIRHLDSTALGLGLAAYDVAGSLVTMALGRTVAGPLAGITGEVPLMVFAAVLGVFCAALLVVVPATRRLTTS